MRKEDLTARMPQSSALHGGLHTVLVLQLKRVTAIASKAYAGKFTNIIFTSLSL